jgi:uncharacterized protein
MTARPPLRPRAALVLLVGLLATVNIARSLLVPGSWHLTLGLATAGVCWWIASAAGLDAAAMGLARATVGPGLGSGAAAFAAISIVVALLGVTGVLVDDRVDVTLADMLVKALVVIPVGTVLVEEIAFRGALHGLLVATVAGRWVLPAGALLFGAWHVLPAWVDGATTGSVEVGRAGAVLATFAGTTVAGAAFVWLRQRSGSLLAPSLAHIATNSVTFAVAWIAG